MCKKQANRENQHDMLILKSAFLNDTIFPDSQENVKVKK